MREGLGSPWLQPKVTPGLAPPRAHDSRIPPKIALGQGGRGALGGSRLTGEAPAGGHLGCSRTPGQRGAGAHRGYEDPWGHPGHGNAWGHKGRRHSHGHTKMHRDLLGTRTHGTHWAWGHTGHRDVPGMGTLGATLGCTGHRATQGRTGTHRASAGISVHGATFVRVTLGAHRVSSGSDSGSRVLGFCSIHRNSIKECSAPTEWAPPPVPRTGGGHGGGL